MAQAHDPDFDPIVPPPGAPDQLGVARAPATEPTASSVRWSTPAPEIRPANPDAWSTTVPLEFPLVVDGDTLEAITIRRPTGADIAELMEEDETEATLPVRLRARICGLHPAVFGALWTDDSERVADACRPFLPRAILDIEAAPAAESATA